jgi:hypothetical protein
MRNLLGRDTVLGYCTNVHAGATLTEVLANLGRYALNVKARVSPGEPMGVGLWLSAQAARQLRAQNGVPSLRDWLGEHGLLAYTLNGFPYGDFHGPVVKHAVYEPDWTNPADPRRLQYTQDLAVILGGLLPEGAEGSISTLPVGWGASAASPGARVASPALPSAPLDHTAAQLTDLVHFLARLELDTGHLIHVDLEPEPGCALQRSADVVAFFQNHLLGTNDELSVRSYLRVCHDVCHSAIMFEDQEEVLARYRSAGIKIGKVQVSSALRVAFDDLTNAAQQEAFAKLGSFDEARYLHQTTIRHTAGNPVFFTDLAPALASVTEAHLPTGEWRVHFHVPIYLAQIGLLSTTQDQIAHCLRAIRPEDEVHHFEVETYAWGVLPETSKAAEGTDLAEGIARELKWLMEGRTGHGAGHAG